MKKPETVEVKLDYRHSNGFTRNCDRTLLVFSTRDWCAQCPDCGGYLFITPFGTQAASPGTPSIADITWIDDYGDEVQGMSEAIEKLRNWRPNQPPLKWCDLKKAVEEYDKLIEDYERTCPVPRSLDGAGKLKLLDNCVGCLRVERDELLAHIDSLRDWKSPDGVLQVQDLHWFKGLKE